MSVLDHISFRIRFRCVFFFVSIFIRSFGTTKETNAMKMSRLNDLKIHKWATMRVLHNNNNICSYASYTSHQKNVISC